MQMMNFSELRNKEHPTARHTYEQKKPPSGWEIENIDAPFFYSRIHSKGLHHMSEVACIDAIAEQFIDNGGSIARPKMHIPSVGTVITCRDTIGHLFSFIEIDTGLRPEKFLS